MVNGDAEGVFPTHPLSLPRPGHSLHSDATAYGLPPSSVPTASGQASASKIAVIPLGVGSGIATGNVAVPGAEDATPTYSVTGYGGSPSKVLPNRAIVQVDAHGDWAYIPAIDSGQEGVIRDSSFTVYGIDDRGVKTKTVVTVTTHDLDVGYRTTVGNGSVTGRLSVPDGVLVFSPGIGPGKGSLQTNANGTFLYTASDDVAHGETQTFTCWLDELYLLPGRYRVNTAVFVGETLQDHIEGAALFEVENGPVRGRVMSTSGPNFRVGFPHRWVGSV